MNQPVAVGDRESRSSSARVPVFLYHGLSDSAAPEVPDHERNYWLPEAQFRAHLSEICQKSYQMALLEDLWNGQRTAPLRKASVVLTFDDGRSTDYEIAFPVLLERGSKANFFVNTARIGKEGFLNWQQIAEMHRAGMSFHSHSHEHVVLTRLSVARLADQLSGSKRRLEDRLGCPIDFLSVPYGLVNRSVIETARRVGYRAVCTSRPWPARPGAPTVSRLAIYRHTTMPEFRRLLEANPFSCLARVARQVCLFLPKQILVRYWPSRLGLSVWENQG